MTASAGWIIHHFSVIKFVAALTLVGIFMALVTDWSGGARHLNGSRTLADYTGPIVACAFVVAFACAYRARELALRKGLNEAAWTLVGFVLGPVGVLMAACARPLGG